MSALRAAAFVALGAAGGAALALAQQRHPGFVSDHPWLVAGCAAALLALAVAHVQRGMNRFERGHEARAEAFRVAMLAQYAPERLERELSA